MPLTAFNSTSISNPCLRDHTLPDEDDDVVDDACTNKIHRALANDFLVMLPTTNHHLLALLP